MAEGSGVQVLSPGISASDTRIYIYEPAIQALLGLAGLGQSIAPDVVAIWWQDNGNNQWRNLNAFSGLLYRTDTVETNEVKHLDNIRYLSCTASTAYQISLGVLQIDAS